MLNPPILGIALLLFVFNEGHAQDQPAYPADSGTPLTAESGGVTQQTPSSTAASSEPERPTWGVMDATGSGVVVHRSDVGELAIGAYTLVRYINQLPGEQQFTDHLGNVHEIDTRNDIQFHRAMIHFRGWLLSPKARYQVTVWTVMSTDQTTLYGFLGYQFHKRFNVYGGINSLGGTRSVMGSHPFWLAHDRVMTDEFFRPSFTGGAWVNGELMPGFWYHATAANNLSQLGIAANQLDRGLGTGVDGMVDADHARVRPQRLV